MGTALFSWLFVKIRDNVSKVLSAAWPTVNTALLTSAIICLQKGNYVSWALLKAISLIVKLTGQLWWREFIGIPCRQMLLVSLCCLFRITGESFCFLHCQSSELCFAFGFGFVNSVVQCIQPRLTRDPADPASLEAIAPASGPALYKEPLLGQSGSTLFQIFQFPGEVTS